MAELPRGAQVAIRMAGIEAVAKPGAPAAQLLRSNRLSGVIRADQIEAELRKDPALPLVVVVDQTRWRVGDFDEPATARAALAWAERQRAQGRRVVVRPSGEEGHWHIWVEVHDPDDGKLVAAQLQALGADVRKRIRDPFGPHRVHGWVDAAEGRTLVDELAGFLPAPVGIDREPRSPRALRDSAGHDCQRYQSRSEGLAGLTLAAANRHQGDEQAAWEAVSTAGCPCMGKLAERDREGDGGRRWWSRSVWASAAQKAAADRAPRPARGEALTDDDATLVGELWAAATTRADVRRVLVLARVLDHRDEHEVAVVPVRAPWLEGLGSSGTIAADLRALVASGLLIRVGEREERSSAANAYRLSRHARRVPTGGVGPRARLIGQAVFALVRGDELTPLVHGGGLGYSAARGLVALLVEQQDGGSQLSTAELAGRMGLSRSSGYRVVGTLAEAGLVEGGHDGWTLAGPLAAAVEVGEVARVLEPLVTDRFRWLVARRELRSVAEQIRHREWLRRCSSDGGGVLPFAA